MSKKAKFLWVIWIAISLLMNGCKPSQKATQANQVDAQAVYTAAVETANAKMTEMAAIPPSVAPSPTPTGTPTATLVPSATSLIPTVTLTQPALVGNLADRAEFVTDVTVPDFTVFAPSQPFVKTWRIKNIGTSSWTPVYSLVFYSGNQLSGPASIPFTKEVKPGETVDISVNLVSSATLGQYTGYWILRNALGQNFGVGPTAAQAIYVIINVASSGTTVATTTVTGTPATKTVTPTQSDQTPTITPTNAPPGTVISSLELGVDNGTISGACPHIFNFTTVIDLSSASSVTFVLEAGSDSPGYEFNLPDPITKNLKVGINRLHYEMTLSSTVNGWVQVHITSPEDLVSDKVNISLTCTP
jgi:Ig-like domain from next to BRCA1 gene